MTVLNLDGVLPGDEIPLAPLLPGVSSEPVIMLVTETHGSKVVVELTYFGITLEEKQAQKFHDLWGWI